MKVEFLFFGCVSIKLSAGVERVCERFDIFIILCLDKYHVYRAVL